MKKTFWTGDKLVGISAMIISLSTLVVLVYQTNLIRKQQYMAVYPHLNLTNYNTESLNYKYVLKNEGVGPAFLTEIHVKAPSGDVYNSLKEYVYSQLMDQDSVWIHYSDIYEGKLISAGEEVILFGLSDNNYQKSHNLPSNTVEGADKLRAILNDYDLEVEIAYESIYGEQWSITHRSSSPVKH